MLLLSILQLLILFCAIGQDVAKLNALIVDGQNNHKVWPKSTVMMKQYLEETGLFDVEVCRTRYTWNGEREAQYLGLGSSTETIDLMTPKTDSLFAPNFAQYDVVISNFGWKAAPWPKETEEAFDEYLSNGGGFVSVHAADNCFPNWREYNEMIGLGGWGDRTESSGPYIFYDNEGNLVEDNSVGTAGAHGAQHEFPVTIRVTNHPITQGMPEQWLTVKNECYAKLRGPGKNMTILATGKDQSENAPTNRNEPVLMVIAYGKGRVFHTTLGHDTGSFEGVGFITSFQRGAEWAATGLVTQDIPDDFPNLGKSSRRPFVPKGASH